MNPKADPSEFLFDGPRDADITLALAHGAGAPMDTPFMTAFAKGLAADGIRVARFEFPFMAARRSGGSKRPPDRQPKLVEAWQAAIVALGPQGLVIGGKSLGGRIASLVADDAGVMGLVCLGYPFHPVGKPDRLRIDHLERLHTPTLIVQGTRDPFGRRDEVETYPLSEKISFHWAEDGNHDLVPRKASGRSAPENWIEAVGATAEFLRQLPARGP